MLGFNVVFYFTFNVETTMIKQLLQFGIGATLLATSVGALADHGSQPLKVSAIIQERPGPSLTCPSQVGGVITGAADSALLGRIVLIATDCITQSGPLFNFSDGKMILVTTDGQQVYVAYSGQFVPTGVGTNYVFSGATFQIYGGTGKYKKATGGGTLSGGEDVLTGVGTAELSGTINY
jgi:hypothetical protein